MKRSILSYLHIFILFSFAAAPIYELTGKYATFFVAHDLKALDIFFLVFVLSILLPLVSIIILYVAKRLSARLMGILFYLLLFSLLFLIVLPVMVKLASSIGLSSDIPIIFSTLIIALLITAAHLRSPNFKLLFSLASPAIIIIPVIFLFFSPVHDMLSIKKAETKKREIEFKRTPPIVMIIFDEFSVSSLMDAEGNINAKLFPNFAALAIDAHWFRNATTVSAFTGDAVPAILTGNYPPKKEQLANLKNYPDNLFTLLGTKYRINSYENHTQLVPSELKARRGPGFSKRISPLFSDLYILYLHMISPPGMKAGLPEVGLTWEDFGVKENDKTTTSPRNRKEMFLDFIDSINAEDGPTLNFIHSFLPHNPWVYYPSGGYYGGFGSGTRGIDGLIERKWQGEDWQITQNYQKYMLQVAFTDNLLGQVIKRLTDTGLYEKSLIVVLADHGISFRNLDQFREITDTNYPDIMGVPLLIKEPFQKNGGIIHDRNVETIDVVPTIAGILGVRIPWETDGSSMLDEKIPEREKKIAYNSPKAKKAEARRRREIDKDIYKEYAKSSEKRTSFTDGLYKIGPYGDIVGRKVAKLLKGGKSKLRITMKEKEQSGFIAGTVSGLSGELRPIDLAIVRNGKVTAVTRTTGHLGTRASFSAIILESAPADDKSGEKIEIFEITGSGDTTRLLATTSGTYSLRPGKKSKDAHQVIALTLDEKGAVIKSTPIVHSAMLGRVDKVHRESSGQIYFRGWAADTINNKRPDEITIFYNDKFLLSAATTVANNDEAGLRGAPEGSGFNIVIPAEKITDDRSIGGSLNGLRFFAISKDGRATELNYLYGINDAPALDIRTGTKEEIMIGPNGEQIPIRAGILKGKLSSMRASGEDTIFSGWAYDIAMREHPESILLFSKGRLIRKVRTSYYLPELVRMTGFKGVIKSGFIFDVPRMLHGGMRDLRIFAVSKDGVATELEYPKGFKRGRSIIKGQ